MTQRLITLILLLLGITAPFVAPADSRDRGAAMPKRQRSPSEMVCGRSSALSEDSRTAIERSLAALRDRWPAVIKRYQALEDSAPRNGAPPFRGREAENSGYRNPELRIKLVTESEIAQTAYAELHKELKVRNPEYATLVRVDPIDPEELQSQVLDDDTTLVEYFVPQDDGLLVENELTLAWVIDRETVTLVPLDIRADELRADVDYLRASIGPRSFDRPTAAKLYQRLLAPLEPHLHHRHLVIVPHGVLHYLPFAALWNSRDRRFLVEEHTLSYSPSASVLRFLQSRRQPEAGRMLVLGDPDGSLPAAAKEAGTVAGLYGTEPLLGRHATEGRVRAQADQIDLLHLAAHGVYRPEQPLFSHLKLAADDQHDGLLEVHEVFGLDLANVELVVLSACRTQLGPLSRGDEIVGLSCAFLFAGTPSLVASLWAVDDGSTALLMERFYRRLKGGVAVAEALTLAQRELLDDQHGPFAWAGFVLSGDWERTLSAGGRCSTQGLQPLRSTSTEGRKP